MISIEKLEQAVQLLVQNAKGLLTEAELLYKNGHYQRAYFLAHVAIEELGKIPILTSAPVRQAVTGNYNWKKMLRRIRSHQSKTFQFVTLHEKSLLFEPDNAQLPREVGHEFLKRAVGVTRELDFIESRVNDLVDARNDSLYVKFEKNDFVAPEKSISQAEADETLQCAKSYLTKFDTTEKTKKGWLREKVDSMLAHPQLVELLKRIAGRSDH